MSITTQVLKPKQLSQRKQKALLKYIASGKPANRWMKKHSIPNSQLYNTLRHCPTFRNLYACAREQQAGSYIDDMMSIVDNVNEDPASRRVRADARKWAASKIDPDRWGERMTIESDIKVSLIEHLQEITKNVTPTAEQLED